MTQNMTESVTLDFLMKKIPKEGFSEKPKVRDKMTVIYSAEGVQCRQNRGKTPKGIFLILHRSASFSTSCEFIHETKSSIQTEPEVIQSRNVRKKPGFL